MGISVYLLLSLMCALNSDSVFYCRFCIKENQGLDYNQSTSFVNDPKTFWFEKSFIYTQWHWINSMHCTGLTQQTKQFCWDALAIQNKYETWWLNLLHELIGDIPVHQCFWWGWLLQLCWRQCQNVTLLPFYKMYIAVNVLW